MKQRSTSATETADPGFESRSLAKGLQILELLSAGAAPLGLKDVAEAAGLGKASTLRLLRTLHQLGYIGQDRSGNYIAAKRWSGSDPELAERRMAEAARPFLVQVASQFGETVAFAQLRGDLARVVDVVESLHPIRMSNFRGRILQPYASSLGKAIAAYQSPERTNRMLNTYGIFSLTPATQTGMRKILLELAEVKAQGFAWDKGETVCGGQCVGVPIRDETGLVVASMSISMPKERFTAELETILPPVMKKAALQIEKAAAAAAI